MKVITEEDLIARRNKLLKQGKNIAACMVDELIHECKEIDTLTVSRLRPMVDLYEHSITSNQKLLAYRYGDETPVVLYSISKSQLNNLYEYDEFIGWIPMPIYKPEKE